MSEMNDLELQFCSRIMTFFSRKSVDKHFGPGLLTYASSTTFNLLLPDGEKKGLSDHSSGNCARFKRASLPQKCLKRNANV
jgi:hypothetical protein